LQPLPLQNSEALAFACMDSLVAAGAHKAVTPHYAAFLAMRRKIGYAVGMV
jgi:hypothetical protein